MAAGAMMVESHKHRDDGKVYAIKPLVYVAAAVAAIGGLIFGYDIGGSGGTFTMPGFRESLDWPPEPQEGESEPGFVSSEQGWITSVFALGAVAGALPSGYVTDRIGRRPAIMLFAAVFTVGAIIQGAASGIGMLYAGRFVGGIGVGGLSMASTMYMSEIAPEKIRGRLVALQQLCITFGIFLAAALNVGLKQWVEGWRFSYCGNGFMSAALFILMFFCPESPRWLYKVHREDEARHVLDKTRQPAEVNGEMEDIAEEERLSLEAARFGWADLFRSHNNMRFRTILGVAVLGFQQLTGINAIMYFAPVIFNEFLSSDLALIANLILMFINFLATFLCIAYVDKFGRRALLIWGSIGMALTTGVVCGLASPAIDYVTNTAAGWSIVAFCALYVVCFAFSWGPVGWVVPSEVFPLELRGKGMTLSTAGNWLVNFIIGRVTPELLRKDVFDLWGTFLLFGSFCVMMGLFTVFFVPETKEVPLEQMDSVVAGFRKLPYSVRARKWRMETEDQLAPINSLEIAPVSAV